MTKEELEELSQDELIVSLDYCEWAYWNLHERLSEEAWIRLNKVGNDVVDVLKTKYNLTDNGIREECRRFKWRQENDY